MFEFVLSLFTGGNSIFLILTGAIIAFFAHGARQRVLGARKERAKQDAAEKLARDVHDEIQNDIGTIPPDQARKELSTWDK